MYGEINLLCLQQCVSLNSVTIPNSVRSIVFNWYSTRMQRTQAAHNGPHCVYEVTTMSNVAHKRRKKNSAPKPMHRTLSKSRHSTHGYTADIKVCRTDRHADMSTCPQKMGICERERKKCEHPNAHWDWNTVVLVSICFGHSRLKSKWATIPSTRHSFYGAHTHFCSDLFSASAAK